MTQSFYSLPEIVTLWYLMVNNITYTCCDVCGLEEKNKIKEYMDEGKKWRRSVFFWPLSLTDCQQSARGTAIVVSQLQQAEKWIASDVLSLRGNVMYQDGVFSE